MSLYLGERVESQSCRHGTGGRGHVRRRQLTGKDKTETPRAGRETGLFFFFFFFYKEMRGNAKGCGQERGVHQATFVIALQAEKSRGKASRPIKKWGSPLPPDTQNRQVWGAGAGGRWPRVGGK